LVRYFVDAGLRDGEDSARCLGDVWRGKAAEFFVIAEAAAAGGRAMGLRSGMMTEMAAERKRLEQELARTLAELEQVNKKLEEKADYSLGEGDSSIYEWEFNFALRQSLEEKAKSIQAALRRIEEGSYGICEVCGRKISPERLAALPHTTLCIECARNKH